MASLPSSLLLLLSLSSLLLLLPAATAQSAPAPEPPGPVNVTRTLEKAGQFTTFMRLLAETHSNDQINNQLNNSQDGMTIFAPTDNAFNNLPDGSLNNLTNQQHVQLVQYHILSKYYTLEDFQTISNPVRTQAGGGPGQAFVLNIISRGNQFNVSTGTDSTPVNNAIRLTRPLAVYQVDKVLMPKEFSEAPPPASPPAPSTNSTRRGGSGSPADGGAAAAPSTGNPNGAGKMSVGLGLISGIGLSWLALLV